MKSEFDKFFETQWPDHAAVLEMYKDGSPAVNHLDTLVPRNTCNSAKLAWNAAVMMCREECLSVGKKDDYDDEDSYDYVCGYQDACVDCDEVLKDLIEKD